MLKEFNRRVWIEVIGVTAVVTSLVFVGWEIRLSNRIAISDAETALRSADREFSTRVAENPELAALVLKLQNDDELNPIEDVQASNYANSMLASLTQANQVYLSGLLTDYSLNIYQTQISEVLDYVPGISKYWARTAEYYDFQPGTSPIWDTLLVELGNRGYLRN